MKMDKQNVGTPEGQAQAYQPPELHVLGTLADMTQQNFAGTNGDSMFFGFGGTS